MAVSWASVTVWAMYGLGDYKPRAKPEPGIPRQAAAVPRPVAVWAANPRGWAGCVALGSPAGAGPRAAASGTPGADAAPFERWLRQRWLRQRWSGGRSEWSTT